MSRFADSELTGDAFLGGRIRLLQPVKGYRAGVDPVLLAAAVPAQAGQSVLDLGCGAGAAILCLAARVTDLSLTGIELQAGYADLAGRNAAANDVRLDIFRADISDLPARIRQSRFDHVIANPPYYAAGAHSAPEDPGRGVALGERIPLEIWIDVAARRLAPKGFLHMIQRTERLPEMLAACEGRLGSVEVLPLSARSGRAPGLVILRARKGGRAKFRLHAPLVLHQGHAHERDEESYAPHITAVLREAKPLEWPA